MRDLSNLKVFKYYSRGDYKKGKRENEFLFMYIGDSREKADELFQLSTECKIWEVYVKEEQAYTYVDFVK